MSYSRREYDRRYGKNSYKRFVGTPGKWYKQKWNTEIRLQHAKEIKVASQDWDTLSLTKDRKIANIWDWW